MFPRTGSTTPWGTGRWRSPSASACWICTRSPSPPWTFRTSPSISPSPPFHRRVHQHARVEDPQPGHGVPRAQEPEGVSLHEIAQVLPPPRSDPGAVPGAFRRGLESRPDRDRRDLRPGEGAFLRGERRSNERPGGIAGSALCGCGRGGFGRVRSRLGSPHPPLCREAGKIGRPRPTWTWPASRSPRSRGV